MSTIFSTALAIFIMIPFLSGLLVFLLTKLISQNNRKAMNLSIDVTTVFFIFSVHFLLETIWGKSFFWIIILVLIVIAMAFAVLHWKVNQEIIIQKVLKSFWRFSFLLFSVAYLAFTLFGIIKSAIQYAFYS